MNLDIYDVLDFVLKVISATVAASLAVWRILKSYIDRQINYETSDRKLADTRIEEKLRSNNEKIHVQMGKIELIDQRLVEQERVRMAEMFELKTSLQQGLHNIEIQLERLRRDGGESHTKKGGN